MTTIDPRSWPQRVGVHPGDTVLLMADVTRMAWIARRAGMRSIVPHLLDAFREAVGPEGLLLVPTFTYDLHSGDAFDVRSTRTISGALGHAALEHPGFLRTAHPFHSFAVSGREAQAIAARDVRGSFEEASPFGLLHQRKGLLVAFDLPVNDALTFVHYVEQRLRVPYRRDRRMRMRHTDAAGRMREEEYHIFAKRPGYINEFTALGPKLLSAGAMVEGGIDGVRYLRVELASAYAVIADDIQRNGARSIHRFRWSWWWRDALKAALRTFGIRTGRERLAHAARTS